MSRREERRDEAAPLGCAQYAFAYCLASYALSAFALDSHEIGIKSTLFAPLTIPAWFALGVLFIGNSELPSDSRTLTLGVSLFILLYLFALWVVRWCLIRRWVAVATGAALVIYLALAAVFFS